MSVITSSVETVTPEKAALWLANNCATNRKMSPGRIKTLVDVIKSGNWVLTHQGIAFSPDGELLDGQHRLSAIARAGVPVPLLVSRNVPADSFTAMDRGWNRSMKQVCVGIPEQVVYAASWLVRLQLCQQAAQPYHVHSLAESAVGKALARLVVVCCTKVPRRNSAPTLAVAALRWLEDPDYIEEQWRSFLLLRRESISPQVWNLVQQIDRVDRLNPEEKAARSWIGFDPARRFEDRIVLRDIRATISEIREALESYWAAGEGVAE